MSVHTGKHGAVESVKYLLHYTGDKLGESKQHVEKWLKAVEDDASEGVQHAVSVARCIGIAADLVTGDHWKDATLDTIGLKIYDILKNVEGWYKESDPKKKAEQFDEINTNMLDSCFEEFDKIVDLNEGHFSGKLTWLDFFFVAGIEVLEYYLGINLLNGKYFNLLKLCENIWSIPEIKNYIFERKAKIQDT